MNKSNWWGFLPLFALLPLMGCDAMKKKEVRPVAVSCDFPREAKSCTRAVQSMKALPMPADRRAELEAFEAMTPEQKRQAFARDGKRMVELLDTIISLRQAYADEVAHYRACQRHIRRVRRLCQ